MFEELLVNPKFTGGWTDRGNVQVPNGWLIENMGGQNWIDPTAPFAEIEARHLTRNDVPEHEWDLLFWLDCPMTYKVFPPKYHAANWFLGQVARLAPREYEMQVRLFPDIVMGYTNEGKKISADDPRACQFRFTLREVETGEGLVQDWQSLFDANEKTYLRKVLLATKFVVNKEALFALGVEFVSPFPLHGSNAIFTTNWSLTATTASPPVECPGQPREDYERYYVVLRQNATREYAHQVLDKVFDQKRTIGWSNDDSGMGDLSVKTAELRQIKTSELKAYDDFYATWYPDVKVVYVDTIDDGGPPPPSDKQSMVIANYHLQATFEGYLQELERLHKAGRPMSIVKLVNISPSIAQSLARARTASQPFWRRVFAYLKETWDLQRVAVASAVSGIKSVSPTTKIVYRFVDDNREQYWQHYPDGQKAVNAFLARWWREIELWGNNVDFVESLNETCGTHDVYGASRTSWFDAAFCAEVARRTGGDIRSIILTLPPGNPDHNEVVWLKDAFGAANEYNAVIGPHTYLPATTSWSRTLQWLHEEGRDYHLRPLDSWVPAIRSLGLEVPEMFFGETGPVTAFVREDGRPGGYAGSGFGWRHETCLGGNLPNLIELMKRYSAMIDEHPYGHKVLGWSFFTSGRVGWEYFQLNNEWPSLNAAQPTVQR